MTAQAPNQAWHLDATVLTTQDNRKGYVQLLVDNFSRKILAWKVSLSVSGLSTTELLRQGFASLVQVPEKHISLIVGGFLAGTPIRKLIARVDVSFSNSLIEAVNKILKYRYLFRKPIPNLEHLKTIVETSIHDYNDRPHYALNGMTTIKLTTDKPSTNSVTVKESFKRDKTDDWSIKLSVHRVFR